ncbi:MAG: outer membrane beta-barrel protein [Bacteroidales bacterium]|nr:outer membrane beta-barrel protein [Bacteroidales bacterium]
MKNIFLKLVVIVFIITVNIAAKAQEKGDVAVGGYLTVGSGKGEGYGRGGIGAKFLYNASNRIRLAAEFDYWQKNKGGIGYKNLHNINMSVHLLFPNRSKMVVFYPFVGVGRESKKIATTNINGVISTKKFNHISPLAGAGIDFKLSTKLALNTELRYQQMYFETTYGGRSSIIHDGTLNLVLGLVYKFGQ